MKNQENIPTEVLQALETLERAQAPVELGRPYQTLLDWRRRHPGGTLGVYGLVYGLLIAIVCASYWLTSFVDFQLNEFGRGVQLGVAITLTVMGIRDLIWRPTPPPQSISARIESAIDRWRHAVPAMRDLPR